MLGKKHQYSIIFWVSFYSYGAGTANLALCCYLQATVLD